MNDPLDLDRLEELAAAAEAVAPVPWEWENGQFNGNRPYNLQLPVTFEDGTRGHPWVLMKTVQGWEPDPAVADHMAAAHPAAVRALVARVRIAEAERDRLRRGLSALNDEVCQTLGAVLNYPRSADDPANFPGATDGTCVGEHVAESIAAEAARRVRELETALRDEREACAKLAEDWASGAGTVNDSDGRPLHWWEDHETAGHDIADAIRARGGRPGGGAPT